MKVPYILLLSAVIAAGLFLRLYRFQELTTFWLDQAVDLIVVRRFFSEGILPMVGPYLSVEKFTIPPTYYYLLIFLNWIGKTPEGTALLFFVLDIIGAFLLYLLSYKLVDKWYALLVAGLYLVSAVMVSHARSMWQPHPVLPFLIGSLLSLYFANSTNKLIFYIASVFFYVIALSIYPSPIVLLPYFVFHGTLFFQNKYNLILWKSVIYTFLAIVSIGVFVYLPLLLFEYRHGWPFATALTSGSFSYNSLSLVLVNFLYNVYGLFAPLVWLNVPFRAEFIVSAYMFAVLFTVAVIDVFREKNSNTLNTVSLKSFIALPYLVIGFLCLLGFKDMQNIGWPWYRMYAFIPFLFMLFGLILYSLTRNSKSRYKLTVVLLVLLFIYGNAKTTVYFFRDHVDTKQVSRAREISQKIYQITQKYSISREDVSIIAYSPTKDWSSYILPELYMLWVNYGWNVRFNEYGNNLIYDSMLPAKKNIIFLCREFWSEEEIQSSCLKDFQTLYPAYIQRYRESHSINSEIFLFTQVSNTAL